MGKLNNLINIYIEIKFRAWDKLEKRMITHRLTVARIVANAIRGCSNGLGGGEFDSDRYVIMQWTGLTDFAGSDGSEIFVGDIVEALNRRGANGEPYKYVIDYDCLRCQYVCRWIIKGRISKNNFNLLSVSTVFEVELHVIGNIYENPELLKRGT